jgi:hypothetical protein
MVAAILLAQSQNSFATVSLNEQTSIKNFPPGLIETRETARRFVAASALLRIADCGFGEGDFLVI